MHIGLVTVPGWAILVLFRRVVFVELSKVWELQAAHGSYQGVR
jgi:hypothetical protein